jgi:murein endopeptidase
LRKRATWALVIAACAIGNALILVSMSDGGFAIGGVASARGPQPARHEAAPASDLAKVQWRHSKALGEPYDGTLVDGVHLPKWGTTYTTWDLERNRTPNRPAQRWGTDTLIRTLLNVLADYHRAHPGAPRVVVGDLSLRHGGYYGHLSHQNGLDVDVFYPRNDGVELPPESPDQIDHALAQDLVNRFVRAGAQYVFVGPSTGLTGPKKVVQVLYGHDQHMHVRIPNPASPSGGSKKQAVD